MTLEEINSMTKEQKNEELFKWMGYEKEECGLWGMYFDENLYADPPDFHKQAIVLLDVLAQIGKSPILIYDKGWSLEIECGDSGKEETVNDAIVNGILNCLHRVPDKIHSLDADVTKEDTGYNMIQVVPIYYNLSTGKVGEEP